MMENEKGNPKQLIYSLLFCMFLFLYFSGGVPIRIDSFISACDHKGVEATLSGKESFCNGGVSELQEWIFDIIGAIGNFFTIAIIVGIFAYLNREFKIWAYLAFGFCGRFLVPFIMIIPFINKMSSSFDLSTLGLQAVVIIFLQILSTLGGSLYGYNYAINVNQEDVDKKDVTYGTIWGISKRLWVALSFSFFIVFKFLLDFSIIQIYIIMNFFNKKGFWLDTLTSMFSGDAEHGLVWVFSRIFGLVAIWSIYIFAFYFSVEAVKNKEAKYRNIKIIGILIVVPLLIQIIPLLRNRTWFFF